MSQATLYLFDSFSLIFRAYFAMGKNPLINSKGQNVSAISGFTSTLFDIIQNKKPTYLACAFDAAYITDRQVEYDFYKANRQETPEDIKASIPYIKKIVEAFNVPILEVNGYEADDLIGTIARQAETQGIHVYMVTPDKDMTQLVTENISVYKPPYMGNPYEILGPKEVCEKWEVEHPLQVIDILGLWGDAVDNIPGVKGVGEKTAKKLIQEYGSMENIYAHIDEIKGSLKDKLEASKEMAFVSKQLATIVIDAPISFDKESFLVKEPNKETLSSLFAELEFRTLGKRILGEQFSVVKKLENTGQMSLFGNDNATEILKEQPFAKNIKNVKHEYDLILTVSKLREVLDKAKAKGYLSIDTETTGIDPMDCDLVGISISWEPFQAYYIPWSQVNQPEFKSVLNEYLADSSIEKIGQNIKYDLLVLGQNDMKMELPFFDTMVSHYLIDPDTKHNMDFLAETYLNYTPISIEELIGKKGPKQLKMSEVDLDIIKEYAAEDADITLQLAFTLQEEIKTKEYEKLYREIEAPLIPVLAEMERAGVAIDTKFLKDYSESLNGELLEVEKQIFDLAGIQFNMDSPKQLGEVLFDYMKIPYQGKKTKTGQYSTNEETLQKLAFEQPIIAQILDYRELRKLKSTYIDALPNLINPRTGLVHTTFNQTIVATGRLSSTNPNLQNIPIRTERGKEIRKAFIARGEGRKILSADYSQIELRIIASLSEDKGMIAAFEQGQDIHAATAANVYNVPLSEVDSTMRRNAKMVNFGIIYGISAFGLAQRLGIDRAEAANLIEQYFSKYPSIKQYMEDSIQFAKKHGYVQTICGRRRYLRDINSSNFTVRGFAERNAINAPIQGSAADMIKLAMKNIYAKMSKEKLCSQIILQVHDELLFDVFDDELSVLKEIVHFEMKNALKLNVPIEIGIGIGENWLEAH
ncbi:MAG: DNA polymerase I [Chitinophagales bacterium]|nr:DNA polymerase I [Chitinophagales bacterium]MCZ2394241.1 DNA polymerase I [Chitinophagales bacterium]